MRESLDQTKEASINQSIEDQKKQKELSRLKKKVARKAMTHDPARNRKAEEKEKMKSFR